MHGQHDRDLRRARRQGAAESRPRSWPACLRATSRTWPGQKCVESTGIKWSMVQECVTKKGTRYLLETGLKTWKIQSYVARVPLVVVDGEMDNYVEYYAQKNFMKIMCEHLTSNGYSISPCASAEK
ncbi:hypothetical protein MRX96_012675 [Rhipicephalus microplus]